MTRKKIWMAAVMIGCAGAGAWLGRSRPVPSRADASQIQEEETDQATSDDPANNDADCQRLLTSANPVEANAWLSATGVSRGVARWEKTEAIELVKQFYADGAITVWVVDTEKVAETEVAAQFIVQLPSDPAAREKVFDREADFEAQYGDDPTPDTGQKFLHLTTD